MTTQFGVHSEVGVLRKVMVCRPGLAHLRLTPDNCKDLLFDDVIWVQEAKNEHYKFVEVMRDRGIDVVDMHELLATTLEDAEARAWVLDRKINPDRVALFIVDEVRAWLNDMPAAELAEFLIGGIATSDAPFFDAAPEICGPDGLHRAAAAQHAVHARYHLLDLRRRDGESHVLARAPAGNFAGDGHLQIPSRLQR